MNPPKPHSYSRRREKELPYVYAAAGVRHITIFQVTVNEVEKETTKYKYHATDGAGAHCGPVLINFRPLQPLIPPFYPSNVLKPFDEFDDG